jgi:predicted kinase
MEFHARNFQKFALALADARDVVIVDNTNLREEHREPYVKLARAFGYQVEMPVVGEFTEEACKTYAARNVHGVPLEGLRRMASSVQLPEEGGAQ